MTWDILYLFRHNIKGSVHSFLGYREIAIEHDLTFYKNVYKMMFPLEIGGNDRSFYSQIIYKQGKYYYKCLKRLFQKGVAIKIIRNQTYLNLTKCHFYLSKMVYE